MTTAATTGMFYVCDSCGHIEVRDAVPEGDEWSCEVCSSHAAWEFPPEKGAHARSHAYRIADGIGKGSIFRHATRALGGRSQ
jgi:DNA-directed RNA polymerase subunit RPC12/RpoP